MEQMREQMREVSTPGELRMALKIREEVFTEEQSIPASLERDGRDETARHVLLLKAGLPVATGRLVVEDGARARLERIAVVPSERGRGYGRRIIGLLEQMAREAGVREVRLSPHEHLTTYYERLGYEQFSGTEHVGGHTLVNMQKRLEGRP
jgi:predicted GNAT family N-acyltransferase